MLVSRLVYMLLELVATYIQCYRGLASEITNNRGGVKIVPEPVLGQHVNSLNPQGIFNEL